MNIRQMEYIVEVAKTGKITEAAQNLHISVATVSQAVTNFEEKFGVILFKRSRLGTVPTEEGIKVVEKSYEILNKISELKDEISSQNTIADKELKLICSPSTLLTFLPKAIAAFQIEFPHTKIKIIENQNVIKKMLSNETDIGFISVDEIKWIEYGNMHKNLLHFETLFQGSMFVCVNKHSSLAFKTSIEPKDLINQTLILHSITEPIYEDFLQQYGSIKVLFESNNTETIKKSVVEGIGISFLSEFTIKNDPRVLAGQIIAIPLVNYERSNLTCGFIRPNRRHFSTSARGFIKLIKDQNKKENH